MKKLDRETVAYILSNATVKDNIITVPKYVMKEMIRVLSEPAKED